MVEREESKPDMLSPEWSDYVLSLLSEDEMRDGNPLVHGLRRLAEKFIGEIIFSSPVDTQWVKGDAAGRASVRYEVAFLTKNGTEKRYGDVADAWEGNTDDIFLVHAPAMASTRAEARALRKALKLKAVSAEELHSKDNASQIVAKNSETRIQPQQVNLIDKKCQSLDIDVEKFISVDKIYESIHEVEKDLAIKMIKKLNKFTNETDTIPDSIKSYKTNWRK
jgi:hypothetical protein